jgi:hypothetical protein
MNVDHDASLGVNGKALRFNMAVDFVELSGPVGPNLVVSHRRRSVDDVGPVDIFMKSGQRRVDAPGVECRRGASRAASMSGDADSVIDLQLLTSRVASVRRSAKWETESWRSRGMKI